MTEPVTRAPHRYAGHDEYVLEEMRGLYVYGTREDRLRLLAEANEATGLPYELAVLAVDDADPLIRRWMARNARDLDFRERAWPESTVSELKAGTLTWNDVSHQPKHYKYPDRDLWDRLRTDSDSFVRVALYENPHFPKLPVRFFMDKSFVGLPHIDRLALVRNPSLTGPGVNEIILRLFDASDDTFGLTVEQRTELALAYLSTPAAIEASQEESRPLSRSDAEDPGAYIEWERERKRLWELLTVFPGYDVRWYGFRHLGGKDKWKAAAYGGTADPWLRQVILANTSDRDVQTLKLAAADTDEDCREIALEKLETSAEPETPRAVVRWAALAVGVLVNLIEFAVILFVLDKGVRSLGPVVVPSLAILYLTLCAGVADLQRGSWELSAKTDRQFAILAKRLNDPAQSSYEEMLKNEEHRLKSTEVRFWVDSGFRFAEWVAAVGFLFYSV